MADTTGSDASGSTAPARGGGASDDPRHGQGADPYLKSMLLGLIEDSYLHTGSFTQFAAEILQVIAYAATVPVAFTEGFLRAYLSIDRIEETDEGRIKIIPRSEPPKRTGSRTSTRSPPKSIRAPCSTRSCAPS